MKYLTTLLVATLSASTAVAAGIHFPIYRRNGSFSTGGTRNLSELHLLLSATEWRYITSFRDIKNNEVVRRWNEADPIFAGTAMLDGMGPEGGWYTTFTIGRPPQSLDFDINMLHSDFYTTLTTSGRGQAYNTSNSETHVPSSEHNYPLCLASSDTFYLPSTSPEFPPRLTLSICTPPKSTGYTLLAQGSVLGLGPAGSLSRLPQASSLLSQLSSPPLSLINAPIVSLTLLSSTTGILSLGTILAIEAEHAKLRAALELEHLDQPYATTEWIDRKLQPQLDFMRALPWQEHYKWVSVQGAKGWWTTLMEGVWVDGVKILRNQEVLLDINCPVILAPPVATDRFYDTVGGSSKLHLGERGFFAVPCLRKVDVALEFGGWRFPIWTDESGVSLDLVDVSAGENDTEDADAGTGYCIGTVVETRMGVDERWQEVGMMGMWVLGEPFFRCLGVVMDHEEGRIGFRSY